MNTTIHHGNNLDILPTIPDNTFDAIITDPPYELGFMGNIRQGQNVEPAKAMPAHEGITNAARQWSGWGTALKPAHEPIVLARKPLVGTVANNALTHGTGALNIDACRIQREPGDTSHAGHRTATFGTQNTTSGGDGSGNWEQNNLGRWPANIILDPEAAEELGPEARYFYCAKPSKAERNAGLDGLDERQTTGGGGLTATVREDGSYETASAAGKYGSVKAKQHNHHPTVKPLALMRYLIRLITPPEGTVLDPFAGSGTTLTAATLENRHSTGIELTDDYIPIIKARTKWASEQPPTLLQ